tara:strand:- start:2127 stop:2474 length:348 start_codon:yes stop_codon:yes gene_type:complete
MDEIKQLMTLIDNGSNITENYKKTEELISIEYAKIKEIKEKLELFDNSKEKTNSEKIDENVRKFLNLNRLEDDTLEKYFHLLRGINYLIDKNEKEEVKIKKLLYKSKKLKIKNIN